MEIKSEAFQNNGLIPSKYTCDGENINLPLTISKVPKDAKSLVLIMEDPDVPKHIRADGMWDHWIIFNIPPNTVVIEEGKEPEGIHGIGTAGNTKYFGPCPPDREHRYFFKLFALDTKLNLSSQVTKSQLLKTIENHIIDRAELIGRYERKK